jgi:hypothetical protein
MGEAFDEDLDGLTESDILHAFSRIEPSFPKKNAQASASTVELSADCFILSGASKCKRNLENSDFGRVRFSDPEAL